MSQPAATPSTIDPSDSLGRIATSHPHAVAVMQRHRLDFCCGGARSLEAACDAKGIDVQEILDEIQAEQPISGPAPSTWDERPLNELIEHIVARYHRPLDSQLPSLEELVRRVAAVHGPGDPRRFAALVDTFEALRSDLEPHMVKEESVLFPWLLGDNPGGAGEPIRVMLDEHDAVAGLLRRLRELADDYEVPADACGSWRALWMGLEALEASLHEHIHLENNVLFPRALS